MDATAIDHHAHFFPGFAKDTHHLMEILAEFVGIKMGHDFIEDTRGAILDRANDVEQHAAGDPTPGTIALPGLACEGFCPFDLARAQGSCRQAIAPGASPPPCPREGKTPNDGLIFVEQNDLALVCTVLQGGEFEAGKCQLSGVGIELASRTTVAQRVFFNTPRTLSRPS